MSETMKGSEAKLISAYVIAGPDMGDVFKPGLMVDHVYFDEPEEGVRTAAAVQKEKDLYAIFLGQEWAPFPLIGDESR